MTLTVDVGDVEVLPLSQRDYWDRALELVSRSIDSVFVEMFVVEPVLRKDKDQLVRRLLKALAAARARGVDVRVVLGVSATADIYVANYVAFHFLRHHGVPVRAFRSKAARSLHSKTALIDHEFSLLGSANWSPGGFAVHDESNLLVRSRPTHAALRKRFLQAWNSSLPSFPRPTSKH